MANLNLVSTNTVILYLIMDNHNRVTANPNLAPTNTVILYLIMDNHNLDMEHLSLDMDKLNIDFLKKNKAKKYQIFKIYKQKWRFLKSYHNDKLL